MITLFTLESQSKTRTDRQTHSIAAPPPRRSPRHVWYLSTSRTQDHQPKSTRLKTSKYKQYSELELAQLSKKLRRGNHHATPSSKLARALPAPRYIRSRRAHHRHPVALDITYNRETSGPTFRGWRRLGVLASARGGCGGRMELEGDVERRGETGVARHGRCWAIR